MANRLYDRAVLADAEYWRIVHYIENNVNNWTDGRYFL